MGELYTRLHTTGELDSYDGHRATPVALFLQKCLERLDGETILACGADRYRRADSETAHDARGP